MEFDVSKVYTAVNADELKVGSQVICADVLADLRFRVESNNFEPVCLVALNDDSCAHRFVTDERYLLAYLVSEPEEKKLKWTDLKVGDVITNGEVTRMVIVVDSRDGACHIFAGDAWVTDNGLEKWEKVEE